MAAEALDEAEPAEYPARVRIRDEIGDDFLGERGLVKKVPCDTDRRGSFVAATARGRREIEAAAPGHVAAVRKLFVDRLTPAQLNAIAQASTAVLAPLTSDT